MTETVPLADVPALAPRILNGEVRGRVVVAVGDRAELIEGKYRDDSDRPRRFARKPVWVREMQKKSVQKRDLAAAQRGLIVQRVLVDGWTPEEAGAPFGIDGQSVARWVAAYQRHGMAALRGEAAVEGGPRRWIECCLAWIGAWPVGGGAADGPQARRAADGGSGDAEEPTRRWN